MKYFILLAMSLVLICLSACGEDSCDDTGTPPDHDTVSQVGDAVSVISSDVLPPEERPDVVAGDAATDVTEAEDAQPEVVADTATPEDTASSSD